MSSRESDSERGIVRNRRGDIDVERSSLGAVLRAEAGPTRHELDSWEAIRRAQDELRGQIHLAELALARLDEALDRTDPRKPPEPAPEWPEAK